MRIGLIVAHDYSVKITYVPGYEVNSVIDEHDDLVRTVIEVAVDVL